MTEAETTATTTSLPKNFFDAHHHFLDTSNNTFQGFLGSLIPNESYLPEGYDRDVVKPLLDEAGVNLIGSIHMECIPDDGLEEVKWIDSTLLSTSTISAIVASCDLTRATVDEDLQKLKEASSKVRGIRWILDYDGKFDGGKTNATHVATTRHEGDIVDYLRGGKDGQVLPEFERGYKLLEKHNLSFDLQCAPAQLSAASNLIRRYPNIKVCINHLGKPRMVLGVDDDNNVEKEPNEEELAVWRNGLQAMAVLPNVYIKISMLGFAIPGWIRNERRRSVMKGLVREVLQLFGPQRCMVATNYWKSDSMSDADGLSNIGPTPAQLLTLLSSEFLSDYSEKDKDYIFCRTAQEFYKC